MKLVMCSAKTDAIEFGQRHTVQIIDLLIKDTFDELVYKKLHGKGAMASVVVDGAEIEALQEYFKDMGIDFK